MNTGFFLRKQASGNDFEALVMPHIGGLYRLAFHYCRQQSDAEDLVQDLLIKLYPKTHELQKIERLRPWLAKSLYHLFIDQLRRQRSSPIDSYEPARLIQLHNDAECGENIEKLVLVKNIEKALSKLNDDQRILVLMHDVENYTLEELETVLNTPRGTLKSRLHRARGKLRQILSADGTLACSAAC